MQKVTNKDGIVIKPGQVWRTVAIDVSGELVSVYANGDSLLMVNSNLKAYYPEKHIAHVLIQSHDGADLGAAEADGWKVWVEGMEKPKNVKEWVCISGTKGMSAPHVAPFPPEPNPDIAIGYKLKEETPKYELFEITWGEVPWLPDSGEDLRKAAVGQWHNGYRIFGFTDDEGWAKLMTAFRNSPSDHEGNRKYAIGRLEQ